MYRLLTIICVAVFLFFTIGCSKKAESPTANQDALPFMRQGNGTMGHGTMGQGNMGQGTMGMPMMKENPMSIKEITGEIQEVNGTHMIVFTTKGVTLKFGITRETKIVPPGKKLIAGTKVKIKIQHVPEGMNAGEVDVLN